MDPKDPLNEETREANEVQAEQPPVVVDLANPDQENLEQGEEEEDVNREANVLQQDRPAEENQDMPIEQLGTDENLDKPAEDNLDNTEENLDKPVEQPDTEENLVNPFDQPDTEENLNLIKPIEQTKYENACTSQEDSDDSAPEKIKLESERVSPSGNYKKVAFSTNDQDDEFKPLLGNSELLGASQSHKKSINNRFVLSRVNEENETLNNSNAKYFLDEKGRIIHDMKGASQSTSEKNEATSNFILV